MAERRLASLLSEFVLLVRLDFVSTTETSSVLDEVTVGDAFACSSLDWAVVCCVLCGVSMVRVELQ
jgi:hypothetical protein